MTRRLNIPELAPWIELRFDSASGPGGQNVNKVSTRATLLLDFQSCALLSAVERGRIEARLSSRLARDGRLRVVAQQERTQSGNRTLAEQRLLELLAAALHVPTARRPTRPTAGSRQRRLVAKQRRGETKRARRMPPAAGD